MRTRVLPIAPYFVVVLAFALLIASMATAASDPKSSPRPVIKKVKPMDLKIGDTLVISGKNFREGKLRNTVIFSRVGAMSVFVKADQATKTQIKLVVPAKLGPFLKTKNGKGRATRFSLRVLADSVSKTATPASLSPVISPGTVSDPGSGSGPSATAYEACVAKAGGTKDSDDDLLSDDLEARLKTDPCKPDTDGDGVEDGYEYYSAIDLNRVNLPYPGKRPYPNPLDASDANIDHDGDSLTLAEEYAGWVRYGRHQLPLNLSAGSARTGGGIRDDERDIDGDGLTNYAEAHGPLSGQTWWTKQYDSEPAYRTANLFLGTDWLDADTDGDGLPDGQDDQDYDGYDNAFEASATRDNGYWTNPFNPCIPDPTVDICSPYLDSKPDSAWPPFNKGFGKRDQGPLPASAATKTTDTPPAP